MWVRLFFIILLSCPFISLAFSQTVESASKLQYGFGNRPLTEEDLKLFPAEQLTRSMLRKHLPAIIDFKDKFPVPKSQGKFGSCVAWAVGYATRSYYAALDKNIIRSVGYNPNNVVNVVSPAWFYQQIRFKKDNNGKVESCKDAGSNIPRALRKLVHTGAANISEIPESKMCNLEYNAPVSKGSLSKFKILDGERLFNVSRPSFDKRDQASRKKVPFRMLDRLKRHLVNGRPIMFGMYTGNNFQKFRNTNGVYRDQVTQRPKTADVGSHALVIVGYNDYKQAFHIQNSYGLSWGHGGYGWISYDSFRSDASDAWIMKTNVIPPRPIPQRPGKKKSWYPGERPLECADLSADKNAGGSVKVTGFVSSQVDLNLVEKKVTENNWTSNVQLRPWPVCEALETLRDPLSKKRIRPVLKTLTGRKQFKVGETFAFEVRAPRFPSYLYLLYLQADGTVVNLAPKDNIVRSQTPSGTVMRFGDGAEGRPVFRASKPAGDETVIAIASRSPLLQLEQFEQGGKPFFRMKLIKSSNEDGPADRRFLSQLRTALLDRPDKTARFREVTASVLHITVKE